MQDAKEEVRARLNIEDVIGEYVELKRAGRNFKGISPFSGEKTPSFFVSPDKHIWHDFSSNKGGDVFSFVMEVEGADFKEALEQLARKAGVDLSLYQSKGSQELAERKRRILRAHELAAQYYQQCLVKNSGAIEYVFRDRALDKATVQLFQIGYAPDSGDALTKFLTKRGFSTRELVDAGLVNRYGKDLFRGRMMVPLMDSGGRVIGFTGRIIGEVPNAPKYLNTPQTLLYDKSRHVFGLSQAKEMIRQLDHAVIVEGNMDVISSHQFGVTQVVATAGTALTEHHLRAIGRLTGTIRLAFDADKAGIAATDRAIGIASELGVQLTIISVPSEQAKDPDELVRKSTDAWRAVIDQAEPAVDWLFTQFKLRGDMTSAAGKRAFTTEALEVVARLKDPVERDHYEQKIATMTSSSFDAIHTKLIDTKNSSGPKKQLRPVRETTFAAGDAAHTKEDAVLALGLMEPRLRELFLNYETDIFDDARQAIAAYLKDSREKVGDTVPKDLNIYDTYVKILLLKAEARYAEWDESHRYYEAAELLRQIATKHKKQQKMKLQILLRDAEANHDEVQAQQITANINDIDKELRSGK